jgi:hypothetical protein
LFPTKKFKEGKNNTKQQQQHLCAPAIQNIRGYPSLCAFDDYWCLPTILLVILCAQSQYIGLVFKRLWFEFAIHPFSAV